VRSCPAGSLCLPIIGDETQKCGKKVPQAPVGRYMTQSVSLRLTNLDLVDLPEGSDARRDLEAQVKHEVSGPCCRCR
jgi:hypothetical protein